MRDVLPLLTHGFSSLLKGFPRTSLCLLYIPCYAFHFSWRWSVKAFVFIILKPFHLNVLLDASSILSHNITNLTCTYIFSDFTRENLELFFLLVIFCLSSFHSYIWLSFSLAVQCLRERTTQVPKLVQVKTSNKRQEWTMSPCTLQA